MLYEISRSANIQTMGMKLSLAMSPSLERFESAGGFSNKFEIDPAVVDQQVGTIHSLLRCACTLVAVVFDMFRCRTV